MEILKSRKQIHRNLYIGLLILACAGLVYSRAALSIAQIGLLANWLLEGNFLNKWQKLKENKAILFFASIWLVHVVGLFYTEDFNHALKDLQIKLPILVLPLIIGSSPKIDLKTFKNIIYIFVLVLLTKTLYSTAILFGFTGKEITDVRQIAFKFSHIRYALLLNLSVFFLVGFVFFRKEKKLTKFDIAGIIVALWMSVFLLLFLKSTTGIALWGILLLVLLFFILQKKSKVLKFSIAIFVLLGILGSGSYFTYTVAKFLETKEYKVSELPAETKNGNLYWHDTTNKQRENGNYTGLFMCEKELEPAWNSKSEISYNGTCKDGNIIKYILIRYLTSKGLTKDKDGFSKLNKDDIRNVENGLANYIYANKIGLYPKLYKIYWQVEAYTQGANSSGHSVTQRVEFLKVGFKIVSENLLFGVGTGDLQQEYDAMYLKTKSTLESKFQLRAHNQFVSFYIAFGLIGGSYIVFALLYPLFRDKRLSIFYICVVALTGFASMVDEDTLETQIGVTFFVLFYSLVIWGVRFNKKEKQV